MPCKISFGFWNLKSSFGFHWNTHTAALASKQHCQINIVDGIKIVKQISDGHVSAMFREHNSFFETHKLHDHNVTHWKFGCGIQTKSTHNISKLIICV